MYGLVNQAVKDMVISGHGEDMWLQICKGAGVASTDFVNMEQYPDKTTYDLVGSASKLLNLPAETILREFGKHWVLYTAREGYGPIMDLFGADFKSCLKNLNNLHSRMGMSMPQLVPPSFTFKELDAKNYELIYSSKRKGLCPMVLGQLEGLAAKFKVDISVSLKKDIDEGSDKVILIHLAG